MKLPIIYYSLISQNSSFIWFKLIQFLKRFIRHYFGEIEGFGVRMPLGLIPSYEVHLLSSLGRLTHLSPWRWLHPCFRVALGPTQGRLCGSAPCPRTQTPMLRRALGGLRLCCPHLEIINNFWARDSTCHFTLVPAHYVAGPGSGC